VNCDKTRKLLKNSQNRTDLIHEEKEESREPKRTKNAPELDSTFREQTLTPNGGLILKPSEKYMKILKELNKEHVKPKHGLMKKPTNSYYYILNDYANLGWLKLR
jgi:hypothetical protein